MKKVLLIGASVALLNSFAGCPMTVDDTTIFETSAVVKWNEVALAAVRNSGPRPTVVARSLFILSNAMYDAWAAYDTVANGLQFGGDLRRPTSEHTLANKETAVSYAAYRVLLDQFPAYEANTGAFTRLLNEFGLTPSDSDDTSTPTGIGNVVAQAILEDRQEDGSNEGGNYAQVTSETYPDLYAPVNSADPSTGKVPGGANFDRNRWQPLRVPNGTLLDSDGNPVADDTDATTFSDQVFLTPHWGAVMPFSLTSGSQFRPQAPPLAGSDESYTDQLGNVMTNDEAYNVQLDEILEISADLTDTHKVIAEYWADGPRSETPPGHWHALAQGICFRDHHSIDDDAKLYLALSGAIFDTSIAVWEAKRFYDFVRPISAIREKYAGQMVEAWGGPNKGTQTIDGADWRPYQSLTFVTPGFAEYPSGHSGFSAASAEVLTLFSGSNAFYDGQTVLFNEDFNADGVADLLGQHVVGKGKNSFESSPSSVITLRWDTFQDAADEAGFSRRYGGIHFQDGDLSARKMGKEIGQQAFELAEMYWNGEAGN